MPEPNDKNKKADKSSKILQFFSSAVKEQRKEKVKSLTKILIRRLPPRLTPESFLEAITLPPHDYFYFVRGDLCLGNLAFSRAYVNITNADDLFAFKEKYDDYLLLDEQGREYHAVVEWAPVQRIPKKSAQKKPTSSKSGILESDPKYLEFLEKLEKEKSHAGTGNTSEYFMETDVVTKESKITTTPLLEYIKLKRQQKVDIRNENRIRKREAEKEKRKKDEEMKRIEKSRREKEKPAVKYETKEDKTHDSSLDTKVPAKDLGEKKKVEIKPFRPGTSERTETKIRDEKFEKRSKITWKNESTENTQKKGEEKISSKPVSSRKTGNNSEKEATAQIAPPTITEHKSNRAAPSTAEKKQVTRAGETKSKFRYSEQRNRDRGVRSQNIVVDVPKSSEADIEHQSDGIRETERAGQISRQSTQDTSDGSIEGDDRENRKDPRTERKIRNKDRPAMEIYRPGMGKFSKQRLEQKKDDGEVTTAKKGGEAKSADDGNLTAIQKPERRKDEDIKPFRNRKILNNSDLSATSGNKSPVSPDPNPLSLTQKTDENLAKSDDTTPTIKLQDESHILEQAKDCTEGATMLEVSGQPEAETTKEVATKNDTAEEETGEASGAPREEEPIE